MLGNQIWFCEKIVVPLVGAVCVLGGGWRDDLKHIWLPENQVVSLRKLNDMGTHITIFELVIISALSIVLYAAGKAAYETWIK